MRYSGTTTEETVMTRITPTYRSYSRRKQSMNYDCVGYLLRTLFKWDHLGRTHQSTSSSVLNRRVSNGELTQIETNEIRLDLNVDECLSVVNTDDGTNHLRENDGVTEVSSNRDWLLTIRAFLLGLSELLDQSHRSSLDTSGELSSLSGIEHLDNISSWHVQELFELNTTIGELSEGTRLLLLGKIHSVLDVSHY